MAQVMSIVSAGTLDEQERLAILLGRVAATPTGGKVLDQLALVVKHPMRLIISAKRCRGRFGFLSEVNNEIVLDEGREDDQLATLAHEIGHAVLSASGFSRENMKHPVGDMVLLKWHEALASSFAAQIVWEAGGEESQAWTFLKEEDPQTAAAFAWQVHLNPSAVMTGQAMRAAAEAMLDDHAFMAALEQSCMKKVKHSQAGWEGPARLRESLWRILDNLPLVLPAMHGRLMMETTHVRTHPDGQLGAFLDHVGWPRDALAEIAFPARMTQPVETNRLASVFKAVAGWWGRGDATRTQNRRHQERHKP